MKDRSMMKWRLRRHSRCSSVDCDDIRRSLEVLDSVLAEYDDTWNTHLNGSDSPTLDATDSPSLEDEQQARWIPEVSHSRSQVKVSSCNSSLDGSTSQSSYSYAEQAKPPTSPPPVPERSPATRLSDRGGAHFPYAGADPATTDSSDDALSPPPPARPTASTLHQIEITGSGDKRLISATEEVDEVFAEEPPRPPRCLVCGRESDQSVDLARKAPVGKCNQRVSKNGASMSESDCDFIIPSPRQFATSLRTPPMKKKLGLSPMFSTKDVPRCRCEQRIRALDERFAETRRLLRAKVIKLLEKEPPSFKPMPPPQEQPTPEEVCNFINKLFCNDTLTEINHDSSLSSYPREQSSCSINASQGSKFRSNDSHLATYPAGDSHESANSGHGESFNSNEYHSYSQGSKSNDGDWSFYNRVPVHPSQGPTSNDTHYCLDPRTNRGPKPDDSLSSNSINNSLGQSVSSPSSRSRSRQNICSKCSKLLTATETITDLPHLTPTDALNRPQLGISYSMEDDLSPGVKEIRLTSTPNGSGDLSSLDFSPKLPPSSSSGAKRGNNKSSLSTFSQSANSLGYVSSQSDLEINFSTSSSVGKEEKVPVTSLKSQTLPIGMKLTPSPFYSTADHSYENSYLSHSVDSRALSRVLNAGGDVELRSSSAPPLPPKAEKRKQLRGFSRKEKKKNEDNLSVKSDLSLDEGIILKRIDALDGSTDLPDYVDKTEESEEKPKKRSVWKSILRRK